MRQFHFAIIVPLVILVASGCVSRLSDRHASSSSGSARHASNEQAFPSNPVRQASCVADYDTLNDPTPVCVTPSEAARSVLPPRNVFDLPDEFWDVQLDEVVHYALQHSEVIRDVGGRVLAAPTGVMTKYDPAIDYTDPNFGVEAALSAFDANLASQFSYENNDRVFNNQTLGGGAQELQQDLALLQTELSKVAATGTQMSLRSIVGHDRNNRVGNLFGHLWESQWEAEVRQPLLQGAGLAFNRIAGPNGRPGLRFSNGVVVAQMNNDISKVDFELAVRGLVSNVVDAYWQLHQAYHDFHAKQDTRIAAERVWKSVQAKYERGLGGGEADKEAQARAQFYLYQDLSVEALNGSGSVPGVYESERQLRLLMGLSVNDGRMLRPVDSISDANILYDWEGLLDQSIQRRAELRRQRWVVKQQEMRLVGAKNFVLPRLDATALYRLRGFGDDLVGDDGSRFSSAGANATDLDHQEWQFGLQFNVPIGRRQAYAGVRHAELRLSRERAVLREQELQISHELANAIGRAVQSHVSMMAGYDRLVAAEQRVEATTATFEADKVSLDLLLESQERLGAARSRYASLAVAHAIAEKNVVLASGDLLPSSGVTLQGDCAMTYASRPAKRRDLLDYRFQVPCPSTAGPHCQAPATPLSVTASSVTTLESIRENPSVASSTQRLPSPSPDEQTF